MRAILSVAGLIATATCWAAPALSDVQAVAIDAHHLRLIVRAGGALAFDSVPGAAGTVSVRLYNVTLGSIAAPSPAPCATGVTLSPEATGSVLLQLNGVAAGCQVAVTQGGNPNTVELRLSY